MSIEDKLNKLHWAIFQDDDPRHRANFRWLVIEIIRDVVKDMREDGSLNDINGVDDRRDDSGKTE